MSRFFDIEITSTEARERFARKEEVFFRCDGGSEGCLGRHVVVGFSEVCVRSLGGEEFDISQRVLAFYRKELM